MPELTFVPRNKKYHNAMKIKTKNAAPPSAIPIMAPTLKDAADDDEVELITGVAVGDKVEEPEIKRNRNIKLKSNPANIIFERKIVAELASHQF